MTRLNMRREGNVTNVYGENGLLLASFTLQPVAAVMLGVMQAGLAKRGGYDIYDEDRNQFLVGDLSQLVA